MKKIIILLLLILGSSLFTAPRINAQMMGFPSVSPDNTAIKAQQQEEQEGKKLLGELQNKTTTCQKLTDGNFEKIGEYFMGQAIGDTSRHIEMNNMMKSMMGNKGEEQMHMAWGKRGSGCDTTAQFISTTRMGGFSMMGYGGIMNGFNWMSTSGLLGFTIWFLTIVNLVLLAVYLWKKIQKK